ncbi:MAG TPA: hypothetical protein VFB72_08485, partial [Verrucomicrobiae bacterium]|nr:hypothetical protein [Verrucomicrobiae bacterium]
TILISSYPRRRYIRLLLVGLPQFVSLEHFKLNYSHQTNLKGLVWVEQATSLFCPATCRTVLFHPSKPTETDKLLLCGEHPCPLETTGNMVVFWGAHASRVPRSASRRMEKNQKAHGETPCAATEVLPDGQHALPPLTIAVPFLCDTITIFSTKQQVARSSRKSNTHYHQMATI